MTVDLDEIRRAREEADCLCSAEDVDQALGRLASDITARLHDKNPLIYVVMNGGLVLAGRLLPRLPFALELAYLHATRYGHALEGTLLDWRVRPTQDLRGRTVLVLDDILDEGHTLAAIIDYLKGEGAREVFSAVLVHKVHERRPTQACAPTSPGSTWPTASCSAAAWTTRATGATPRASTPSRGTEGPRAGLGSAHPNEGQ